MKRNVIIIVLIFILVLFGKSIYNFFTYYYVNVNSLKCYIIETFEDLTFNHIKENPSLVTLGGETLISFGEYDEISEYSLNGLRRVKKQNKYGFIDNNTGKIIIPCRYNFVGEFTGKITHYKDLNTGKFGYINKKEQIIVKPIYSYACSFINGLSEISIDGKHYGFINEDGKVVIPLEYDYLTQFNNLGYANAGINNKFSGYIDKNNKKYNGDAPKKEIVSNYSLSVFNENKKFGVKDKQNNVIIEPKYKFIFINYKEKVIIVQKSFCKFAIFDFNGKQISTDFKCIGLKYYNNRVLLYKVKFTLSFWQKITIWCRNIISKFTA